MKRLWGYLIVAVVAAALLIPVWTGSAAARMEYPDPDRLSEDEITRLEQEARKHGLEQGPKRPEKPAGVKKGQGVENGSKPVVVVPKTQQ